MSIDGSWDRDGHKMQMWLTRQAGIRRTPRVGGSQFLELGLVSAVHYKDAESNVSGDVTEYDVILFSTWMTAPNLTTLGFKNSYDSGDEYTLKATTSVPNLEDPTQANQNFLEADGDLVVVAYLSGQYPVIIGTVNHIKAGADAATWCGTSTEGERRAWHHKDVHVLLTKDSELQIDVPEDKTVIINVAGSQLFKVTRDGSGNNTVELGAGGEALVLGDSFKTWFDSNVASHTHGAGALLDSHGLPCSGITAAAVPNLDSNNLSDVSETE